VDYAPLTRRSFRCCAAKGRAIPLCLDLSEDPYERTVAAAPRAGNVLQDR